MNVRSEEANIGRLRHPLRLRVAAQRKTGYDREIADSSEANRLEAAGAR